MCTWKEEGLILAGDIYIDFGRLELERLGFMTLKGNYSFVSTISPKFSEEIAS